MWCGLFTSSAAALTAPRLVGRSVVIVRFVRVRPRSGHQLVIKKTLLKSHQSFSSEKGTCENYCGKQSKIGCSVSVISTVVER